MSTKKLPKKDVNLSSTVEEVIKSGAARTQHEILKYLKGRGVSVNQSSISRALKKIGAVKGLDAEGQAIYRIPQAANQIGNNQSIKNLVTGIAANENMIIVHTCTGSASVVAQLIDEQNFPELMGTLAGDCDILIVPKSVRFKNKLFQDLQKFLNFAEG